MVFVSNSYLWYNESYNDFKLCTLFWNTLYVYTYMILILCRVSHVEVSMWSANKWNFCGRILFFFRNFEGFKEIQNQSIHATSNYKRQANENMIDKKEYTKSCTFCVFFRLNKSFSVYIFNMYLYYVYIYICK